MSNCGVCGQTNNCACFFIDSCQQAIGEFYVDLPGIAGNFISTPDSVTLSITGDIDIRVKVAADDWTPVVEQELAAKYVNASDQRSWTFHVNSAGSLGMRISPDGVNVTTVNSTATTGFADGSTHWVRFTWRASDGQIQFFTSDDGQIWSQLGSDGTANVGNIFDSTAALEVGSRNVGAAALTGNVYYAEVRNGIGGPIVGVFDPEDAVPVPTSGTQTPSTVTSSSTGEVWTLNGAGWVWGQDSEESCVTVLGSGFGSNHSTISPDFDPLFPGPFKFKSTNTPDPYPMGYIFRSTTQAIPALTHQVIEFDSGAGWPGDMENFAANPYALTVVEDGIYLAGLNLATLDSAGAEDQIVYIRRNGSIEDIAADKIGTAINGTQQRGQSVMALISLVAGDYLEGVIFSGTAKTISITVASGTVSSTPHLWARWMGSL